MFSMSARVEGRARAGRLKSVPALVLPSDKIDLVVNGPLAREMFIKERLRHTGRHGQLLSRRSGKSFAREERQDGVHDSGTALHRIMARFSHRADISERLLTVRSIFTSGVHPQTKQSRLPLFQSFSGAG
jgi:hypothetical protein